MLRAPQKTSKNPALTTESVSVVKAGFLLYTSLCTEANYTRFFAVFFAAFFATFFTAFFFAAIFL